MYFCIYDYAKKINLTDKGSEFRNSVSTNYTILNGTHEQNIALQKNWYQNAQKTLAYLLHVQGVPENLQLNLAGLWYNLYIPNSSHVYIF
jgi:hypothetical protein